jgi:hypothetical protein
MSTKMERGSSRERRDGSWEACNISGTRAQFWSDPKWKWTARERAERFASSVTAYDGRTGQNYVYHESTDYAWCERYARAGLRPQIANLSHVRGRTELIRAAGLLVL